MLIFLLTVMLLKRYMKNAAMARVIIFFVYGLLCVQSLVAQSSKQISSPDGKIQFVFDLSNEGAPVYSISYQQKAVILSSSLGLNGWNVDLLLVMFLFQSRIQFGNLYMANEARFVII